MSKMRYVNTDFWTDTWVVDSLNPLDRYLFVYLFTNPHTNVAGVYELSLRIMSFETGITDNDLAQMLNRLAPKVKYVDGWVVLRNGIKNQYYNSPKIKTAIEAVLQQCPPEVLDYVKWPDDFGVEKPKGADQQQLIVDDLADFGDSKTVEKKATVDKMPVAFNSTPQEVKYPIHRVSHKDRDLEKDFKTTVSVASQPPTATAETAGLNTNRTAGKEYFEVNVLYEDLGDIVNDQFKAWYCSAFFKLGHERVRVLASQARADGKDPKKLFSHLLQKEVGTKPQEVV